MSYTARDSKWATELHNAIRHYFEMEGKFYTPDHVALVARVALELVELMPERYSDD